MNKNTDWRMWSHPFVVSEFDQVIAEDGRTNRIVESYNVLKDLLREDPNKKHSGAFSETPTIIFLNKEDLLRKKIQEGCDVTKNFPQLKDFKMNGKKVGVSFEGVPADEAEVTKRYKAGVAIRAIV